MCVYLKNKFCAVYKKASNAHIHGLKVENDGLFDTCTFPNLLL
jgi:hypothetical protein